MIPFYGREVVYAPWVPRDVVASVWQSAAEVYTPFDYIGDHETATRIVSRRAIERMLDRARGKASEGALGKAITLAKGAAHLAYENGYEDLLNEARQFVTHELEPAYLDEVHEKAWYVSLIHDRQDNRALVWVWSHPEEFHDYVRDSSEWFASGRLHVYYYGADPDSALRGVQWLEREFGAAPEYDKQAQVLLYGAAT